MMAPPRPKMEPIATISPPSPASRMVVFMVLRTMPTAYGWASVPPPRDARLRT